MNKLYVAKLYDTWECNDYDPQIIGYFSTEEKARAAGKKSVAARKEYCGSYKSYVEEIEVDRIIDCSNEDYNGGE